MFRSTTRSSNFQPRSNHIMRTFLLTLTISLLVDLTHAQQPPAFNSGTISGLGARHIRSAAMSGPIAAIAGVQAPSGEITLFVAAATGGVGQSDAGGTRYRPACH